jgi:hypothetical protein
MVEEDGTLLVADAGSTNGTFLAMPPTAPVGQTWQPLGADGTFFVANIRVTAHVVAFEDNLTSSELPALNLRRSAPSFLATAKCSVELQAAIVDLIFTMANGTEWVTRARTYAQFIYLGREHEGFGPQWVSIPDTGVSRQHASLHVDENGTITIHDMGSRNGTYVEDARVQGTVPLGPEGVFYLGGVRCVARFLGFEDLYPVENRAPAPPKQTPESGRSAQASEPPPSTLAPPRASWMNWVRGKLSRD